MAERHVYTLSNGQPIAVTFPLDDISSMALALSRCSGDCEACWSLLHLMVCGHEDLLRPEAERHATEMRDRARFAIDLFIRAARAA